MAARKRFLSLPSQVEMSPNNKYDDVTKDPHFLWSTRKVSVDGRKFWAIAKYLGWTESPEKIAQAFRKKSPYNILSKNSIESSNEGNFESQIKGNHDLKLKKKSLSKSPNVSKGPLSTKLKHATNSKTSGTVIPVKEAPAAGKALSLPKCESVIFLEEIITVNDDPVDFSDKKPPKTDQKTQRSKKMVSRVNYEEYLEEKAEYREYQRLKLKYEGRMNN